LSAGWRKDIVWTITARVPQYPHDRGYTATREEAMAAFKAAWERSKKNPRLLGRGFVQ
jgi:hypothetical protein